MAVKFSNKVFDEICQRIAQGESLVSICKDADMPGYSTIMEWLNKSSDRAEKYARARESQADFLADEMLEVARNSTNETYQPDRLLVDALKWRAAKLRPRVYGDRQEVDMKLNINPTEELLKLQAAAKRADERG